MDDKLKQLGHALFDAFFERHKIVDVLKSLFDKFFVYQKFKLFGYLS